MAVAALQQDACSSHLYFVGKTSAGMMKVVELGPKFEKKNVAAYLQTGRFASETFVHGWYRPTQPQVCIVPHVGLRSDRPMQHHCSARPLHIATEQSRTLTGRCNTLCGVPQLILPGRKEGEHTPIYTPHPSPSLFNPSGTHRMTKTHFAFSRSWLYAAERMISRMVIMMNPMYCRRLRPMRSTVNTVT